MTSRLAQAQSLCTMLVNATICVSTCARIGAAGSLPINDVASCVSIGVGHCERLAPYCCTVSAAKASFWIGKIKISQGLLDEAIEVYKNTIFDFGHDINQDGVDLIISELVRASRKLTIEKKNELIK